MNKVIVTTTINPPTEAIIAFAGMKDWKLVIVGDLKTPGRYETETILGGNCCYLTPEFQVGMDKKLSDLIGWNSIQRRNFGFIYAVKELGADLVATVDDDNLPLPGWGENLLVGKKVETYFYQTTLEAFDPVGWATLKHAGLWHRGFPIQLLPDRYDGTTGCERQTVTPEVQADFWNGDPDVDAFCRIMHQPDCDFTEGKFPIAADKIGPFNSQNTFLSARVMKDYFMFPHVGRMDDIWASFYLQALGHRVVWNRASVCQVRLPPTAGANPNAGGGGHFNNLKGELLGYEHNLEIVRRIGNDPECIWEYCPGKTRRAFEQYQTHFK